VALGAAAGVAVENARLYDAARRQQRWIQASAEVTTRLLSGSAPAAVLADITRPTLELSGADLAVLALPDEEGRRLTITYAEGDGADAARGLVLPAGESLSGQVLSSGEPVTSAEFAADERVAASARMALRQAQRAAEPGQPRRQARRRTCARPGRPGRLPARDRAGMARPPRLIAWNVVAGPGVRGGLALHPGQSGGQQEPVVPLCHVLRIHGGEMVSVEPQVSDSRDLRLLWTS